MNDVLNDWSDRVPQRPLSRIGRIERAAGDMLLGALLLLIGGGVAVSLGWPLVTLLRLISS